MSATPVQIARGTAASVGLLAALTGCSTGTSPAASSQPPSPAAPPASSASPSAPGGSSAAYADGEYRADGVYGSGPSSIGVELVLADGRIDRVEVTPHATNATSLDYQRRFAAAVPEAVEGRPIADLQLGRLAGSSGTPDGFNDALEKIRADARG